MVRSEQWHAAARTTMAATVAGAICLLTAGCTENGGLLGPPPQAPPETNSTWSRVYPEVSSRRLLGLWGQDADDLWIVGEYGEILRYDGSTTRSWPSPTTQSLGAIDGCDRDMIWAVTGSRILRWDGRTWNIIFEHGDYWWSFQTVHAASPSEVYFGCRVWSGSTGILIWRLDGQSLSGMNFDNATGVQAIHQIWKPLPASPPLAATDAGLYRLDGDTWRLLDSSLSVRSVDQDRILATSSHEMFGGPRLMRVDANGTLGPLCPPNTLESPRHLVLGPTTLLIHADRITELLSDCRTYLRLDLPTYLRAIARPATPGHQSRCFFGIGQQSGLYRIDWQQDNTLTVVELLIPDENRKVSALAGADRNLYFRDEEGWVHRRVGTSWQRLERPTRVDEVAGLASGALATLQRYGPCKIDIWSIENGWSELPQLESGNSSLYTWWIDDQLRPRVVLRSHGDQIVSLWGLEDGGWQLLTILNDVIEADSIDIASCAGFAPDDLYFVANCRRDGNWSRRLLHYRGTDIAEVSLGIQATISSTRIRALPRSRRLILEVRHQADTIREAFWNGSELTLIPSFPLYWNELVELDDGRVLASTSSGLYVLKPGGWSQLNNTPPPPFSHIWGHSEEGLFVVANRWDIFHQPPTRGRP